uniref:Uncharacterized protein n=1 Tax=Cacopsylla melanoneura TaxID=428564 RepID=A0A8D8XN82_9HEMI
MTGSKLIRSKHLCGANGFKELTSDGVTCVQWGSLCAQNDRFHVILFPFIFFFLILFIESETVVHTSLFYPLILGDDTFLVQFFLSFFFFFFVTFSRANGVVVCRQPRSISSRPSRLISCPNNDVVWLDAL